MYGYGSTDRNSLDLSDNEQLQKNVKALEAYLNEYDFFSFKSLLERQKLKFHNDYMKAKAIYHENPIYDPDFHKQ